ncbi:MAG TPA: hypothetical protein VHZ50_16435 [Puia sp.]|jgi:hypothetical protein|nr:hypothetical protein [Puia sp.]
MVTILPPKPNAGLSIAQGFNEGLQSTFQPAIQQEYQRGKLQQALGKLREQSNDPNSTPQDRLYNLIEASQYSPEIGRNLPQLYAELNKAREVDATKNVNFGEQQQGFQPGGISRQNQRANPEIENAIQQNQFFPKNAGAQQKPGNLPQEATHGQVKPVLSGDELLQKTQQRQAEFAKNGIIKNFEDVYNQVSNENQQNDLYNQRIELERQKRIESQQHYGELAEQRLKKLIPDASDEESAIARKIGEEAAGENRSQADIDRLITRQVNDYKNSLSNIEKDLQAPRIQNKLQRIFSGKSTDYQKVEQDARAAIKPLIDRGLYEKSRTMLANAGFYPEERENIIFGKMPREIKSTVDKIPKASYEKTKSLPITMGAGIPAGNKNLVKEYDLKSRVNLFDNLSKVWGEGKNDQVNLLQLRKEYEDKGYDWRMFKDSMNELVNSGQIQLNPDQTNTYNSYLNNPPLNALESILHNLGLRGR